MATFTVKGYEIRSTSADVISDMKAAELQVVSALGSATLDFSYASEDADSAEVTLSNYNLLMNGLHLNDGDLPERIELFELNWIAEDGPKTSQVMNFAYEDDAGIRDFLFAVGHDPLPDLSDTTAVNTMLHTAKFALIEDSGAQQGFQIQLDEIPDVAISGVIFKLFEEAPLEEQADTFHFFQPSDTGSFEPDAFEFVALGLDEQEDQQAPQETGDSGPVEFVADYVPDTSIDDFGG